MKPFVSRLRVGLVAAAACAFGVAALGAAGTVHAQTAALVTGGGGPAGFGTNVLPPGDDESSAAIDVTAVFPGGLLFNGQRHTSVFVNINGNVSFGGPLRDYTPVAFPGAPQPMIAAWWGDVDTRETDPPLRGAGVYWHVGATEFIATWYLVGYFDRHFDRRNSFQLILRPATGAGTRGDFDIELRYNRCEWTTGDASGGDAGAGGTPARAGYDAPSAAGMPAFSTLPGSGTSAVLDLCTESNTGEPGVWLLHVRKGAVDYCGNGVPEPGEECDGARTPAGYGCTEDCLLCDGDTGRPCEVPPDASVPDATTPDAGAPDVGTPDVVAVDAGVDAATPPDAALDAGTMPVATAYGGGGLVRCSSAPGRATHGSRAGLAALLAVIAGAGAARGRRRRNGGRRPAPAPAKG